MPKYKNRFIEKINYKNSCIENPLYKIKNEKQDKKWKKRRGGKHGKL